MINQRLFLSDNPSKSTDSWGKENLGSQSGMLYQAYRIQVVIRLWRKEKAEVE